VLPERGQQACVVARVEADRRLVEHVEHPGEAAADLAGQADPLALAAGERGRASREAQIVEPDVDQELEPVANLADQVAGDVLLVAVEPEVAEKAERPAQRPAANLFDRRPAKPDGRGVVAEPRPHASDARDVVDHSVQLVPVNE
jgi:hypothetical protein